jgi:hypothetical protein
VHGDCRPYCMSWGAALAAVGRRFPPAPTPCRAGCTHPAGLLACTRHYLQPAKSISPRPPARLPETPSHTSALLPFPAPLPFATHPGSTCTPFLLFLLLLHHPPSSATCAPTPAAALRGLAVATPLRSRTTGRLLTSRGGPAALCTSHTATATMLHGPCTIQATASLAHSPSTPLHHSGTTCRATPSTCCCLPPVPPHMHGQSTCIALWQPVWQDRLLGSGQGPPLGPPAQCW